MRATIAWVVFAALAISCGLLTILAITSETGLSGLRTGGLLAFVPVVPVISLYLWLDRYEAEPPSLLVFAFSWGAAVATFGALVINTASGEAIRASGGDPTSAAVLVAPFVEEGFKGLALVLVLVLRRQEVDGVIDGLVYAGFTGTGFAFVENILYLGRSVTEPGWAGTVPVFVLRCVASPFAHPLFTSAIGVGIAIAAASRRPVVIVGAPLAGYLVAVSLHGAWNLSASQGLSRFGATYVAVQLPIFVGFVALALLARRREGRLIDRHLSVYARTGWLAPGEVGMLSSLAGRARARRWAAATGGRDSRRAMRDFQELSSELAFLREKMLRGTATADARDLEFAMLAAMAALRGRFLSHPGDAGSP